MAMISNRATYISLSTRKRDGNFVDTPVWFAQGEDGAEEACNYYVFALKKSGKVKRIRNFPDVKIAPCDIRGKLKGDWIDARADLVNEAEGIKTGFAHLRKKYGPKFRIGDVMSWIVGNFHRRQIIRLSLKVTD